MADSWIKMRHSLADDPAVIQIIVATGLDRFGVLGRVYAIWEWADRQTTDGRFPEIPVAYLDQMVQHDGFADAMQRAGWLELEGNGFVLPRFDEHNGSTAKQRAKDASRQAKSRKKSKTQGGGEYADSDGTPAAGSRRTVEANRVAGPDRALVEDGNTEKEKLVAGPGRALATGGNGNTDRVAGLDEAPEPHGNTKNEGVTQVSQVCPQSVTQLSDKSATREEKRREEERREENGCAVSCAPGALEFFESVRNPTPEAAAAGLLARACGRPISEIAGKHPQDIVWFMRGRDAGADYPAVRWPPDAEEPLDEMRMLHAVFAVVGAESKSQMVPGVKKFALAVLTDAIAAGEYPEVRKPAARDTRPSWQREQENERRSKLAAAREARTRRETA